MIRPLLFFVLWILLFFLIANALSEISSSSEAREVLVSKTLANGGSWLVPTRNGIIASKPPLHHWIAAGIAALTSLPVSLWLHRLVSSLSAFGILLLVACAPIRIFGIARFGIQRSGVAVAILALTPGFFRLASNSRVDMVFAFCVTLSMLSFLYNLLESRDISRMEKKSFWVVMLGLGFGCLAKGPLGIVLPTVVMLSCTAYRFGVLPAFRLFVTPRLSWLLVLLVGPLWYLLAGYFGGEPFIERHIYENITRFNGDKGLDGSFWWYYLLVWGRAVAPWSLVFLYLLFSQRVFSSQKIAEPRGRLFEESLLLGCVVGTFMLSLASGKRGSYLLPLYPLFALYLSSRLCDLYESSSNRWKLSLFQLGGFIQRGVFFLLFLCAVVIGICTYGWPVYPSSAQSSFGYERVIADTVRYMNVHGGLLLWALSLVGVVALWKRVTVLSIASTMAAVVILCNGFGEGLRAEYKGYYRFAQRADTLVPPSESIVVRKKLKDERYDVVLSYLARPVAVVENGETFNGYVYRIAFHGKDEKDEAWRDLFVFQTLGEELRRKNRVLALQQRIEQGEI